MSDLTLPMASITGRLTDLGAARWALHFETRRRIAAGENIIELTIGEPDIPVNEALIDVAEKAMRAGRTRYSNGRGEPAMAQAIAQKYATRTGRAITPANVLCLPGTQAALAVTMMSLVETGDAVMVPDPYYATYEGVVRGTGANFVPVPMSAENGFHLTAEQLEAALVPNAKALLLNTPHNPTGAVLDAQSIAEIGAVCRKHGLWIIADEVYEQLIYEGEFASPLDNDDLADITVAVSSISKSHAAPGFRSGWCVGPAAFTDRMQPVSEALLFGSQPFIADMTAHALTHPDDTAKVMVERYRRRIATLMRTLGQHDTLRPMPPEAGMFMLVDVSRTGLDGHAFAMRLLEEQKVATMPGSSFGRQADGLIRLSLTVDDDLLEEAAGRIARLADNVG